MTDGANVEPWLCGSLAELPAVVRAVPHALQLARQDTRKWCSDLTDEELNARPCGVAPVAFHLCHIGRSADRLLSYLDARPLTETQIAELKTELDAEASATKVFAELEAKLSEIEVRLRRVDIRTVEEPRAVGRANLPSTVGRLLVHIADHTQRHVAKR